MQCFRCLVNCIGFYLYSVTYLYTANKREGNSYVSQEQKGKGTGRAGAGVDDCAVLLTKVTLVLEVA